MILSKLSEALKDLIIYNDLTANTLADKIGLQPSTITRILKEERAPMPKTLVIIADYFNVTCDFLLGLEPENSATSFKTCPPFSERIKELTKGRNITEFCRQIECKTSQYYKWLHGTGKPTLEKVYNIAKYLNCSVDYVLGREK